MTKDTPTMTELELADGYKYWMLNDKIHREDGPAIEHPNGDKHWYRNGKLHREDGPAIEWADGQEYWYLNGHRYFLKKVYYRELVKRGIMTYENAVLEVL